MRVQTQFPLYRVETPYGEESGNQEVSYASATSYAATLDSFGIPAKVVYARSVTLREILERK